MIPWLARPISPALLPATLGHIERLLVAADDQVLCVAHLTDKPDPTWFGHLAVIRSSIEALSRVWFLTDPNVTALERSRRLANERLSELQHADSLLANQLQICQKSSRSNGRITFTSSESG